MDRVNLNLYLENLYIMEENERLRRKAQLLNQENKALLAKLKNDHAVMSSPSSAVPTSTSTQQRPATASTAGAGAATLKPPGKQPK
ncbi:hypothetical protein E2562_024553 [Oryza meyeriana var. granulata]|uniref:Protein LITTLE ZIPPER 4 n=1 Tax=Oryza meyeriana var. granulata TaxID=110450 RepID=A0A6G1BNA6_9ORYZ|nr:hypothetical protein E2562_024553 [Oryza meyeriana var. granulata]